MDIAGTKSILKILDPQAIRLWRDAVGDLHLELRTEEGETVHHERVRPLRAFPLTAPDTYITFFSERNDYLGVLESLDDVDERTEELLRDEMERRYFLPQIIQIHYLRIHAGIISWRVETDRGPRRFDVRDRDDIRFIPPRRMVIKDVDGNRFEIQDYMELDDRSLTLLEQLL
ncbi:MAG TPA: DUF1854 domain-containing protein [Armatimonadota bacterium]|jgi:hypothetical protein|nr:DUF1854 domain-containing protein [Armatimonadota bacterium]HOJ20145.1 DUF1854 domain-containing protein [Armatimonadota bacterium]HOM82834.1 DUF1854 domain-containing protein [Armatimonadota bacterium]HPO73387.1 DUF1854 domain-containing protein [Armatimonadota bacterium]HPT98063.1 DUF1854 domain-containing protein [Armatimonadota bacterium]